MASRRTGLPQLDLCSDRDRAARRRAHELIPGGAHTYAKGDDQWPEVAPSVLVRGQGCRVWDVDGNEFVEYAPGCRAVTLGHGHPKVLEAVQRALLDGTNFTRPALIELDAAEALVDLIGPAEMVKFTKDGSTATSAAVRIARAVTGRDMVALCGDHPFFSYDDWFIGTTEIDAGIPASVSELSVTFSYNDLAGVEALFAEHPGRIACVILEPEKNDPPVDDFLHRLQDLCRRQGALFILDEMISGFRYHLHGAQTMYGLDPDLSTFGKALGNGFAISALAGKREHMERGGLHHEHERVFLLSTTHGAENHALAAALAVIQTYREDDVVGGLYERGERLKAGIDGVVAELGLEKQFGLLGRACNLVYFTRDADEQPSNPLRTIFQQEMARRGVLAPSFVITLAHGDDEIEHTVQAVGESLEIYARAMEEGPDRYLVGPPVRGVYRRFN